MYQSPLTESLNPEWMKDLNKRTKNLIWGLKKKKISFSAQQAEDFLKYLIINPQYIDDNILKEYVGTLEELNLSTNNIKASMRYWDEIVKKKAGIVE